MENKELIKKAKKEAESMVHRRTVTRAESKRRVVKWIDSNIPRGGFSDEVIEFWKEVRKQIFELDT
jgi:hypothetical protein